MKKNGKILLSIICTVICLVTAVCSPIAYSAAQDVDVDVLTEITPKDFNINDGMYSGSVSGTYSKDTLLGTVFAADVKFSGDETWFHYAATTQWRGLSFRFHDEGITLRSDTIVPSIGEYQFTSEKAGTELNQHSFRFQISMERCDAQGDLANDDVKLGVYFNGKLYDNQFIYLKNIINEENPDNLGNAIYVNANATGGGNGSIYEILSPEGNPTYDMPTVTPADFGLSDGTYVNASGTLGAQIPVGKFASQVKLSSAEDMVQYGNIRLWRDSFGRLLVSDVSGANAFRSVVMVPENPTATLLTTSHFGFPSEKTYEYKNGDWSQTGTYSDSWDGTYFSAYIKFADHIWSSQIRYAVNGWTGLQIYINNNRLTIVNNSTGKTVGEYTTDAAQIANYKNCEYKLGISIDYVDVDSDDDNDIDDVRLGIWINDALIAPVSGSLSDNYIYLTDHVSAMGNKMGVFCGADGLTLYMAEVQHADVIAPATDEEFQYELTTETLNVDGDVKIGVWMNGQLVNGEYIYAKNYAQYMTPQLTVTGKVASDAKKLSYDTKTYAISEENANEEIALLGSHMDEMIAGKAVMQGDSQFTIMLNSQQLLDFSAIDEITPGEIFTYAVTFERQDFDGDDTYNDLTYTLWIDGKPIGNRTYYLKDCITGVLRCSIQSQHVRFEEWKPTDDLKEYTYSLADGPYLFTGTGEMIVNHDNVYLTGETLNIPGSYIMTREQLGETYVQCIQLWKTGYVNADSAVDVTDLIAMKKVQSGHVDETFAQKGADLNYDNQVTDADTQVMRNVLLGKETLQTKAPQHAFSYEDGVMPIAGYYGPLGSYVDETSGITTSNLLTDTVFEDIADAGINLITYTSANFAFDPETILKGLELGEKHGINMYVRDAYSQDYSVERYARQMSKYSRYQSFQGITVADEPSTDIYPDSAGGNGNMDECKTQSSLLNQYCNIFGYINLYPYYQGMTTDESNYQAYLEEYCKTCNPRVLSFDHYIYTWKNEQYYFRNLELVRDMAKKYKIPFWGFVQAGDVNGTSVGRNIMPTLGETLWNVNTMLAYGAKGIQYYTLVQPFSYSYYSDTGKYDYNRSGLIGANGVKTEFYSTAKAANDQIKAVDEVLMNCVAKEVLAIGTAAQTHTGIQGKNSYQELTEVTASNGAIIGCFDYHGQTALYIVNYDDANKQEISLKFNNDYKMSLLAAEQNEIITTDKLTLSLEAGGAVLVVIDEAE